MKNKLNQDFLVDVSFTGKERPWRDKKIMNQILASVYDIVNPKKSERLRKCSSFLEYVLQDNGLKRLHKADFCRVRLCPVCTWRRGLKIFSQVSSIMRGMESDREYGYIFLTLTVKNCSADDLDEILNGMMGAWNKFIGYKDIKKTVKGWFRSLEITHDVNEFITKEMWYGNSEKKMNSRASYYKKLGLKIGDMNPGYNTFHPHFHCILAVNKTYFKDKDYIKYEEWTSLWKKALGIDYSPKVNVQRVKGNTAQAVAEVSKYAVKDSDYIIPDDWDFTVDTVRLLDKVLDRRRFVGFGGKFKEWHKKLNLDDEMNGDLINLENRDKEEASDERIFYVWNAGYSQYVRS